MEILNDADRQSAVYKKIKKYLEERHETLRKQNDNPKNDVVDTAFIRGRIREISRLLGEAEPKEIKTKRDPIAQ